jgi:uncharacterized protein YxjI
MQQSNHHSAPAPGAHDPNTRVPDLSAVIIASSAFYLRQRVKFLEILTNWDTPNRYELKDESGRDVGTVTEQGSGLFKVLARLLLRSHRGFVIHVADLHGVATLVLSRRFHWIFSDIYVSTPQGQVLGSAHRRFSIFWKKYDLRDPHGNTFATISSVFWRLWTFKVVDPQGSEIACVTKKWGGALKELFTNADTFKVEFMKRHWAAHERAAILGAALSIEFDFFERKGSGEGMFNFPG